MRALSSSLERVSIFLCASNVAFKYGVRAFKSLSALDPNSLVKKLAIFQSLKLSAKIQKLLKKLSTLNGYLKNAKNNSDNTVAVIQTINFSFKCLTDTKNIISYVKEKKRLQKIVIIFWESSLQRLILQTQY